MNDIFAEIQTLADVAPVHARQFGDATAMVFEGRETSYTELDRQSVAVANGLGSAGVRSGDRVALLDKNSADYFVIALGIARAGGVIVGVNYRLADPEVSYILRDAGVGVLFVGEEFYGLIEEIESELEQVELIVALQGDHSRWPSYDSWRASQSGDTPRVVVSPEDDGLQLYTSGTTGLPKGVQTQHQALLRFMQAAVDISWGRYEPGASVMVCMPLYHVAGMNIGLFGLVQAARLVITREVDPQQILEYIPRYQISHSIFVPAVIMLLVSQPNIEQVDMSSLKMLAYGASPIPEAVLVRAREIFQCDFVHLYGMTENQGGATCLLPEEHDPALGKYRSVGRPYPNTELRIVNADGEDVPTGEVGEIILRSNWFMRGYWNLPEATAEAFRGDGWVLHRRCCLHR